MDDLFAAPEEHHSLFFALLPDACTIAGIHAARQALEAGLPSQRGAGVPDDRLHLTLQWLGEWSQLPQGVVDAARSAGGSLQLDGFDLCLDQAECFGHGEAIWVLRPSAPPQELPALHAALARALGQQRLRLPPGPAFAPHVTVRRRASTRFAPCATPAVAWQVRDFALLHSRRTTAGTTYQVLGRWPLAVETTDRGGPGG